MTIGDENNETTGEIFDFAGGCFYGVFGAIRNQQIFKLGFYYEGRPGSKEELEQAKEDEEVEEEEPVALADSSPEPLEEEEEDPAQEEEEEELTQEQPEDADVEPVG